ncbi:MAG: hypothetical protein FJX76_18485 [Armatimonadetes bacterium]|nr:hypothetical protein [Armatimonadota bacterium]
MANILLKWKIQGWERKIRAANRTSFYKEESVSLGPIIKVEKAYKAGAWSEAIDETYKILMRFDDMSDAHYYLGMSLAKVHEVPLAVEHLTAAIRSHKKAMDSYDERYVDDLINICRASGRESEVRKFFEGLAGLDAKGKLLLERLKYQGKL